MVTSALLLCLSLWWSHRCLLGRGWWQKAFDLCYCGWFGCWIALWSNMELEFKKRNMLWNILGNRALTLWTGMGKWLWKEKTDEVSAVRMGCLWETSIALAVGRGWNSFKQSGAFGNPPRPSMVRHSRSEGEFCLIHGTQTGLGSGDLVRRSCWDTCSEVPGGSQDCGFTSFQGNLYKCWVDLKAWFLQNMFYVVKKICFLFLPYVNTTLYLSWR